MKTVLAILFFSQTFFTSAFEPDSSAIKMNLPVEKSAPFKSFTIQTDWLLETKAELINGISYSPTLEFNLSSQKGFNFQLQTGALPIMNGLKINKTQPAAGFSFSYKF
ncbi:MAG: hypothetical protein ABJG68_10670 [Crocinitomicaceae bacterium]